MISKNEIKREWLYILYKSNKTLGIFLIIFSVHLRGEYVTAFTQPIQKRNRQEQLKCHGFTHNHGTLNIAKTILKVHT